MRKTERMNLPYPLIAGDDGANTLNLAVPPEKIKFGEFWKLTGVDGRFTDSVRRFPGFKRLEYSVKTDSRSRTQAFDITRASTFHFFKYASIHKGSSDHTLRGFVVCCNDYTSTNPDAVLTLFLHYDSEDERWYSYKITDLSTVFVNGVIMDCAQSGRTLLIVGRDPNGTTAIAKSIFWRYAPTTPESTNGAGDLYTVQAGRESGVVAPTISLVEDATNGRIRNTDAQPSLQVMVRAFSPLRGMFGTEYQSATLTGNQNTWYRIQIDLLNAAIQSLWEKGFTKLYLYRTIDGGGTFYLEQIVNLNPDPTNIGTGSILTTDVMAGHDYQTVGPTTYRFHMAARPALHDPAGQAGGTVEWSLGMNDQALVIQRVYDPFLDATGDFPKGGLLTEYGDMLIAKDEVSVENQSNQATIRWSTLFANQPENFPEADHVYRPATRGVELVDLLSGGDYAWAARYDGYTRLHRDGTLMAVNELYKKTGTTCRYGSAAVGNFLYGVTRVGLMQLDGTSGRQDLVAALERVFIDPDHWASDLSQIRAAYDSSLGALMILNRTFEFMYVLWFGNGSVTGIADAPFLFVTEGPDPVSPGPEHAWWLGPNGYVYRANYNRTAERQTMCDIKSTEVANGRAKMATVTAGQEKITFGVGPAAGTLPSIAPACEGFWVYFLSGNNAGIRRKVASVTDASVDLITLTNELPYNIAEGDQYSIAPVLFEVGLHGLRGGAIADTIGTKTSHGMTAAIDVKGGDVLPATNPEAKIEFRIVRSPDGITRAQSVAIDQNTTRCVATVKHDGQNLLPEIVQKSSDVDFELLAVEVDATIEESKASTSP